MIMKTFTLKQALEVLNTYFFGFQIIEMEENTQTLDIVFNDAAGKQWELISTGDSYFQEVEDFIIYEL